MTDHESIVYRPPAMRIAATYPATDGSMPESIEVEINTPDAGPELLHAAVSALAAVPSGRYRLHTPSFTPVLAAHEVTK